MKLRSRLTRRASIFCSCVFVLLLTTGTAGAVPVLQLYLEGATYDSVTESWVLVTGDPFTIWVMGNTSGPGGMGDISDVTLVAAFADSALGATISLTGTTAGLAGWTDPSTPANPTAGPRVTDGSSPVLADGSSLPSHGIYGSTTDWIAFSLGDFTLEDSPVADMILPGGCDPTNVGACELFAASGQINAYTVTLSGFPIGTTIHFDAFDEVCKGNSNNCASIFAPFSHDATTVVPEPGTLLLLGSGLIGLGLFRRKRLLSATQN